MSAGPGKVEIQGITEINGEKVCVLRFIQRRNPDWVQRPFFAKYDPEATWLNDLKAAVGEDKFFFEDEYAQMAGDGKIIYEIDCSSIIKINKPRSWRGLLNDLP